jgi:hypothetical protein
LAEVALRLGQIRIPDHAVLRSGIRWLCDDGHICRPGETIAFCNIGVPRIGNRKGETPLFADEQRDLQVALATPVGGTLRYAEGLNKGGFEAFQNTTLWAPETVVGYIDREANGLSAAGDVELSLMMMAGRRASGLAEVRAGLLTGWFDRSRACKADGNGHIGTLLSLGTCELLAIRGERMAFLEFLEAVEGPAHIVNVSDMQLVHSTRVVAEQIRRTTAERAAISDDLAKTLSAGPIVLTPADWIFAGAMLNDLQTSPTNETYAVLTRSGLCAAGPPDAIVLSLNSEGSVLLRHRRLGYSASFHDFRLSDAGPAFRNWLRMNFEPVRRTLDDIRDDYGQLIEAVRGVNPTAEILVNNLVSSKAREDIQNYSWFEEPLGNTIASVRAKDMNSMLSDVARDHGIAIVDSDAIAAELGAFRAIPDSVHPNGLMQAEMRAEILRILRARRVPGFGAV